MTKDPIQFAERLIKNNEVEQRKRDHGYTLYSERVSARRSYDRRRSRSSL